MITIHPTLTGYKLVYAFRKKGKRYAVKRLYTSFLKCKEVALDLSKKVNLTVLIYGEAQLKFKVTGL